MADYNRIYWAIQALGIGREGSVDGAGARIADPNGGQNIMNAVYVPGVQSVGITTTFNLEQVFEMGQLSIYQDVEEVPDVEVSIERVIDSHKLLYSRCADFNDADAAKTIPQMQNNKVDAWFSLTSDAHNNAGDAEPTTAVWMSGLYMSSASFSLSTDGNLTESITLVGNHKKWYATPAKHIHGVPSKDKTTTTGSKQGLHSGRVQRRQNVRLYTQDTDANNLTNVHRDISGYTTAWSDVDGQPTADNEAKITSATISVDFGREQINVLGQKLPYFRYVTFPVEVTCEIEVLARGGDNVDALPEADNVNERRIEFFIEPTDELKTPIATYDNSAGGNTESTNAVAHFDLGVKNKLTSVTWGGGDTGGANSTVTYSYRNFNDLTVKSKMPMLPDTDMEMNQP
tara:strand:- start:221 stop:1423 length:1203 start_codon:yes stop_codon:yes gene_type:complete